MALAKHQLVKAAALKGAAMAAHEAEKRLKAAGKPKQTAKPKAKRKRSGITKRRK